jgi:soluble lytic murein transglycosylase-like protein
VIAVESAGNPRAVSRAGAMGLMQVMPGTWAALRQQHGLGDDPFDPRDNILAGTAYLRAMYDRYGIAGAMLAAYNAGPGRYDDHLDRPPAARETRAYVATLAPIGQQRTAAWIRHHRSSIGARPGSSSAMPPADTSAAPSVAIRTRPRPHRETFRPGPRDQRSSSRAHGR